MKQLDMKKRYYVYEWIRLDTNEPFYVGKGCNNRWKELNRKSNKGFMEIVQSTDVAVNILNDKLTEVEALELEAYYINEYCEIGYEMANKDEGGLPYKESIKHLKNVEKFQKLVAKLNSGEINQETYKVLVGLSGCSYLEVN